MSEYEENERLRKDFNQEMTLCLSRLQRSIESEKAYTRSLIAKAEQKAEQKTAPTPTSKPIKPEQLGMMSDRELLQLAKNPEKFAEMMSGW